MLFSGMMMLQSILLFNTKRFISVNFGHNTFVFNISMAHYHRIKTTKLESEGTLNKEAPTSSGTRPRIVSLWGRVT